MKRSRRTTASSRSTASGAKNTVPGEPCQFDVFANPDVRDRAHPYFIILQSNQLADLNTRIVAPLVPPQSIPLFDRLMPSVEVAGESYVIDPTNLGVVRTGTLRDLVDNLADHRDRILAAVDLVFFGI